METKKEEKTKSEIQKSEFKCWLEKMQISNKRTPFKETCIRDYIDALEKASNKFTEAIKPYTNIFEITDVEFLDKAISIIKQDEEFGVFNQKIHSRSTEYALQWYQRFLERKSINEKEGYLSTAWFKLSAENYEQFKNEATDLYKQFKSKYSPDKLRELKGNDLLDFIFLGKSTSSLCYALEYDKKYELFGGIAGGTAYKYFLFYSKKDETWKTSIGNSGNRSISQEEALEIGEVIRNALVKGSEIISNFKLETLNNYSTLFDQLKKEIPNYITKTWVLKYYHMIFPDIIPTFYNERWQNHILYNLNIVPSKDKFIRMGQINYFIEECNISSIVFSKIVYDKIGAPKTFYRVNTGEKGKLFNEWCSSNNSYMSIGWNELGNLSAVYQKGNDSKEIITEALKDLYNCDDISANRIYGEINDFYSVMADDTYIVAMTEQKVLAIGAVTGEYFFDADKDYGHCRPVRWLKVFNEEITLPEKEKEELTEFCQLNNSENVCYLCSLLNEIEDVAENQSRKITFETGYKSEFSRNRILFGAPGTGKSYTLNNDRKKLLYGDCNVDENILDHSIYGEYERVTFHPDYSYANFVGTYKPVPCKDSDGKDAITYSYVPGPFMRTYVKALKNSRTNMPKPFLLIIEEINRANVAAVFGDVFQLLDRGVNEVSEYPIQASEDIKKFLSLPENLGGNPDDYSEIRIPDNMFIWATMNSADQGVFPMDTAFKRRWDFTYLGIDNSENEISDFNIILGNGAFQRDVIWNNLRKAINEELLNHKLNEDKLMGPYFIAKKNLSQEDFIRIFKNKVIMYLFEDAAKQKRNLLFSGCDEKNRNQYSKICREFDEKGVFIFCDAIKERFKDNSKDN